MAKKVICFGEVLWDVFPTHQKIGGAPLNVALRLNSLGIETAIASQVGEDDLGDKLLSFINKESASSLLVQKSKTYPTGQVNVVLDNKGAASYEIAHPAAWDKINIEKTLLNSVKATPFFLFGSLIARDNVSKGTLFKLLENAQFKIFDVNLRPPHYDYPLLMELMTQADFIKFNEDELLEICSYYNGPKAGIKEQLLFISHKTNTQQLCVTLGEEGALLYDHGEWVSQKGFAIKVADTVGAGDSFLATLVAGLISNRPPAECLQHACAMGAIVASKKGANPVIPERELLDFIKSSL